MPSTTVSLGPFLVNDLDRSGLLATIDKFIAERALDATAPPAVMFSLHVGGLNLRNDPAFVAALHCADLLVADGISVAGLARLAGASGLYRHPTTDAGWEILRTVHRRLDRPVRVALLGGPPGLASRAGVQMASRAPVEVVYATHGYHSEWAPVLAELAMTKPDVVVVGMGMPAEALWVAEYVRTMPPRLRTLLVLTCGGWFGHIVGDEKRAPTWMRRAGLEWLARLAQQPRRLAKRYASGLWSVLAMIPAALCERRKRSHGKN